MSDKTEKRAGTYYRGVLSSCGPRSRSEFDWGSFVPSFRMDSSGRLSLFLNELFFFFFNFVSFRVLIYIWMYVCLSVWMDVCMSVCLDGWMDGCLSVWYPSYILIPYSGQGEAATQSAHGPESAHEESMVSDESAGGVGGL